MFGPKDLSAGCTMARVCLCSEQNAAEGLGDLSTYLSQEEAIQIFLVIDQNVQGEGSTEFCLRIL